MAKRCTIAKESPDRAGKRGKSEDRAQKLQRSEALQVKSCASQPRGISADEKAAAGPDIWSGGAAAFE
jgi:hypothetical protein